MNIKQERIQLLEAQIARLQRRVDAQTPRSNVYSWSRVAIFFVGIALSLIVAMLTIWWIGLIVFALAMVLFGVVAHYHGLIERSIARHTLWQHIKSAHLARMKLDWDHIPTTFTEAPIEDHPFEIDLDMTGSRSLHRLVNTGISREGSLRLRDWLLQTKPDLTTIQQRQGLVRELIPMTRFRDRLILNSLFAARGKSEQLDGERLLQWLGKQDPASSLRPLLWISAGLNLLTIVLLVVSLFVSMPPLWIYTLVAGVLLFFGTGNKRGDIFEDASYLRYGFGTLSLIFSYLEKYPYKSHPQLSKLCAPFYQQSESGPTALLQGMARISSAATLKNNGLAWILVNAFVPWDLYCADKLLQQKSQLQSRLPVWLDTWFELEALCSLASFAYLNPEYIMPEVHEQMAGNPAQASVFRAEELGHPLIPVEKKISNSFGLDILGEVVIVTGSNMAGKSTFLRTLGVNLCLAYAGGPVNARSFDTALFRLFTCLRVTDSVTDGYSYFYAEVRRLHALLDALNESAQLPLFFLVDEIFKGTNNRERLIGSRSFVKALVGRNCVGLISTHDLELVKLADSVPQVSNKHFREEVIEGHMAFDYILRDGPCPTTNALKIMALEGLPIDG
ncbi:MutS family DNA mismatch repair protein [Dictyobacter arantiisoli]|uniref:DNA mismatch repair protein n=1 Tax=Dictyobacter arantiisoli TaxID=2014874 RepID=A0A5A5T8D5_9CHLR|nr:MutS family DNA mismatch repair protein [Dictyobacter arantiisoli]GCF07741.1 DNA mismatch repair protein [Dictyobacter arantiisoli]